MNFLFLTMGILGQDGIKRNKKANGKLLEGKIVQNMLNIELPNDK